jgi:hypothetical protein
VIPSLVISECATGMENWTSGDCLSELVGTTGLKPCVLAIRMVVAGAWPEWQLKVQSRQRSALTVSAKHKRRNREDMELRKWGLFNRLTDW